MSKSTLYLENFGPIKKAEIDVTDMLVFIGGQASGKSTLAKLITIINDFNFRNNSETKLITELEKYGIQSYLSKKTIIDFNSSYFTYKYSSDEESKTSLEEFLNHVNQINNVNDKLLGTFTERIISLLISIIVLDGKTDILAREISKTSEFGINDKLVEALSPRKDPREYAKNVLNTYGKQITNESFKKLAQPVRNVISFLRPLGSMYIPAERSMLPILSPNIGGLINNNIKIPKHILAIIQEYEKAIQTITDLELDIIGKHKFSHQGGVSYIYHSKTKNVLLTEAASGIQTILPLLLLVQYSLTNKNYINLTYVVEEPEINLYPAAQYKLMKYLVKNCLEIDGVVQRKNLIITTHSPYILTSINNLLYSFKKGQINPGESSEIISTESWISPAHFNAYEIKNGTVNKIFNNEEGLIEENIIDEVTEDLMDDFKTLAIIK